MLDFMIAIAALLTLSEGIRFYFTWKKLRKPLDIMKGAESFFYKKGKVGVLLLHGFSSTPQELRGLGIFLANKSATVYAPLIAGHGTIPEDLARTRSKDWIRSAEKALRKLRKVSNKVFIIGNSFGGNLAVLLCLKHKVDGIVLLGTPVKFKKEKTMKRLLLLLPIIKRFTKYKRKKYNKKDLDIIKNKIHYPVIPLNCIPSMYEVIKQTKIGLKNISIPSLVMQSTTDGLLSADNSNIIYNSLSSQSKKLVSIPNSYHVFVMDSKKRVAFNEIDYFLKQHS